MVDRDSNEKKCHLFAVILILSAIVILSAAFYEIDMGREKVATVDIASISQVTTKELIIRKDTAETIESPDEYRMTFDLPGYPHVSVPISKENYENIDIPRVQLEVHYLVDSNAPHAQQGLEIKQVSLNYKPRVPPEKLSKSGLDNP